MIGKTAYFECNFCNKMDVKTSAHAIKNENENGEEWYELIYWPIDHDCAPSATRHLAKNFTDRCYAGVENDPMKSIFQIYKDVRSEMGKQLTSAERLSFLSDIPELHSIKVQMYGRHRKFIPKAPQSFVSNILL